MITNLLSIFFGDPRDVPWNQEDYILEVLAREGREMYALEIVKASKRVSRGVIYIVLTRMVTRPVPKRSVACSDSAVTAPSLRTPANKALICRTHRS